MYVRTVKRHAKLTSSSADDVVAEVTYDANGNLATSKDARGFITTFCYDVDEVGATISGSLLASRPPPRPCPTATTRSTA